MAYSRASTPHGAGAFSCSKTNVAMIHSNPNATPADPPPDTPPSFHYLTPGEALPGATTQRITTDLLAAGESQRRGWSKAQLAAVGVEWPPLKGWKSRIVGLEISADNAAIFVTLKDAHLRRAGTPKITKTA